LVFHKRDSWGVHSCGEGLGVGFGVVGVTRKEVAAPEGAVELAASGSIAEAVP
jgi:hypothetical protein